MAKRVKGVLPPPVVPVEVSNNDRAVLAGAYKAGLIVSWKFDIERGYRLARPGRPDEYVALPNLVSYLEKLKTLA